MDVLRKAAGIARTQYGLTTRAQLTELGVSPGQIQRWLRSGRVEALHPGVYRLAGAPPSWEQEVAAAVLAVTLVAPALQSDLDRRIGSSHPDGRCSASPGPTSCEGPIRVAGAVRRVLVSQNREGWPKTATEVGRIACRYRLRSTK